MTNLRGRFLGLKRDMADKGTDNSAAERLERNIRVNIYHGIASILALNLAAPFVGIFAVKLGASDYQIGLLSSAPALVSLLSMIPGGKFIDRKSKKQKTVAAFILAQRVFYLFMATIPFFTQDKRAWLLVLAATAMNAPASIANVGWQAFISRLVPASKRAAAFAARNRTMNLVGTAVVLIAGRMIDIIGFPVGYQVAFAAAFVFTLLEIWVLNQIDESTVDLPAAPGAAASTDAPTMPPAESSSDKMGIFQLIRRDIAGIVKHGPFIRYTLASIAFYMSWQTPWPLFTLYQTKVLNANNMWVSLLSLANTSGSLVGYGFWVKKMNKYGNLRTLFMSSVLIFIVPLAYGLSKSLAMVAGFNMLTGAVFSGVNLALFNTLLEVTPEDNKATYIAYYTTAVNASAIFAPMLGVGLLDAFGYFWAFMICAAMRFVASFGFLFLNHIEKRIALREKVSEEADQNHT